MRLLSGFFFAAACLLTCPAVFADTTWVAGGDVSGLWTHDGSPYMILGDIRVTPSETLSIGPGVTVFFAVRCSILVAERAILEAVGAEGDSIYFTTDTLTLPERWNGFRFYGNSLDTCRFEYCVMEYRGGPGLTTLYATGTPLVVRASSFRHNTGSEGAVMELWSGHLDMSDCVFESNAGSNGGAMTFSDVSGLIEDCVFRDNHATGYGLGGALDFFSQYLYPFYVRRCDFIGNSGNHGGAIALESTDTVLVIEDSRFISNTASETGGVVSTYVIGGKAQFRRCLFDGNRSHKNGGALYLKSASVVDQCVFANDMADSNGGAIYFQYANSSYPVIRRSTFYHNRTEWEGAAIYLGDWASVEACTFVRSIGDNAIHVPPNGNPPTFRWFEYNLLFINPFGNFSENNAGLGDICCANRNGDPCDEYYNVVANPQFVDTVAGDFHLLAGSPCIDAGHDSSYWFPFRDPDGTIADIGAFYYDQTQSAHKERTAVRRYELMQNYPNPFNSATRIEFDLPQTGNVELAVFDITGRRVAELMNETLTAGHHNVTFDASAFPSGVYLYHLRANDAVQTRKMVLLK